MHTALTNIFLEAMSSQVHASFQQRCLRKPIIVFVDLFLWFVNQNGKRTAKDCKANWQRMAAYWHPANGFDALILHLFTGAAYASSTGFRMNDVSTVNIGFRIIKQCGVYGEELERAAKARWNNQVPNTVPSQLGKSRNLPHTGILMKTYQVR